MIENHQIVRVDLNWQDNDNGSANTYLFEILTPGDLKEKFREAARIYFETADVGGDTEVRWWEFINSVGDDILEQVGLRWVFADEVLEIDPMKILYDDEPEEEEAS